MFITVHHTFIRRMFTFITPAFFTIPSHLMNMTPFINEGDAPPDERGEPSGIWSKTPSCFRSFAELFCIRSVFFRAGRHCPERDVSVHSGPDARVHPPRGGRRGTKTPWTPASRPLFHVYGGEHSIRPEKPSEGRLRAFWG